MKIREPLINIIHEKTEKNFEESKKIWEKYENMINNKNNLDDIPDNIRKPLFDYFKKEENKEILLNIFDKDIYDFLIIESNKKNMENNN